MGKGAEMEVSFPQVVIFTTEGRVSVADVAHSLLANEELVLHVGKILEFCIPGLTVEKVNVVFTSASTNSPLKEILGTDIYLTFQDELKGEVPGLIESLTG